jgi:GTP:adenosylcobinamide-phosphate guanylyltransferase
VSAAGEAAITAVSATGQALYPYLVHFMQTVVDEPVADVPRSTGTTESNRKSHKIQVRREDDAGHVLDLHEIDVAVPTVNFNA